MATKKKMLQAAAGNAGGEALNVEDVFSTYLYEGNGGSQAIENGINLGQSFGSGSVKFNSSNSDYLSLSATSILNLANDYTIEMFLYNAGDVNSYRRIFNNAPGTTPSGYFYVYTNGTNIVMYNADSGSLVTVGTLPAGAWFHLAISRSGSTTRVFVNGTQSHSYTGTTNFTNNGWFIGGGPDTEFNDINISNFRVVTGTALYTSNFTPPTSDLTDVTNTALLTCQGPDFFVDNSSNSLTITKNGGPTFATFGPFDAAEAGEGGLVWVKDRTGANGHNFYDTERGATKRIASNLTSAETTRTNGVTSFNANGFSGGNDASINTNGNDYASWTFRKAPKFFTCLTYTGNQTVRTISHNLGSVPGCIIIKNLDQSDGNATWQVYHRSLSNNASRFLRLNTTDTDFPVGSWMNDTAPTSTEFTLGTGLGMNWSGQRFVAYLFAHNDGDGDFGPDGDLDAIKCGSYTGNGSSTGPEIDLGFEPQWLLAKNAGDTQRWVMYDNMRGVSTGGEDFLLQPHLSSAEGSEANALDFTATGFKINGSSSDLNRNGDTIIYIAIRRGTKVPESGTEVFAIDTGTNPGIPTFTSGFPVDMGIFTATTGDSNYIKSRLTGDTYLFTNATNAEATDTAFFDNMDGWENNLPSTYLSWMWKRAPGYFDVVCYEWNGTATRNVEHNLGVPPEMYTVKRRNSTTGWYVRHKDFFGTNGSIVLNTTAATAQTGLFTTGGTTDTTFPVANDGSVNASGGTYIAYLFATLDGISKVGSYTGNGSSQTINCGFTSGARFILIKRTDSTGDWYVWDTERGIVAGNDPHLSLNTTAAEVTTDDSIDPDSSGFIVNQVSATNINVSSAEYIFYAIA